jgi:hypothetical protein
MTRLDRGARAALAATLLLAGCGPRDGLSDNERRMLNLQNAAEALRGQGAKVEEKHYPIGDAYAVNLSGMTITDDLLKKVKSLGNISELDFSKSTLNDGHLGVAQEMGMFTLVTNLDLSNTAVTDAGFEKLDNLRFLSQMNLAGTKVTPAAVERFKAKRLKDERVWERFRRPTIKMK